MKKSYVIYAALADQTDKGWVWFKDPELPTRTIVKVYNPASGRKVFCESRKIDNNFRNAYNKDPRATIANQDCDKALVMSEWYRCALGVFGTTKRTGQEVELGITKARI